MISDGVENEPTISETVWPKPLTGAATRHKGLIFIVSRTGARAPARRFPEPIRPALRQAGASGWVRGMAQPARPGRFSDSSGRAGGPCLFGSLVRRGYGASGSLNLPQIR